MKRIEIQKKIGLRSNRVEKRAESTQLFKSVANPVHDDESFHRKMEDLRMKPKVSADWEIPTREVQEYRPKGNRMLNEVNKAAYNVSTYRKERVGNRAAAHLKKNTGQGTSKDQRYRGDRNTPRGSFDSQMNRITDIDPNIQAYCQPLPPRGGRTSSLMSPERAAPVSLKRKKTQSEEPQSTSRAAKEPEITSPRRNSLDTSAVPPPQKRKKPLTKQNSRIKMIENAKKNVKKMNK